MNSARLSACVFITVVITAAIAHAQVYVNPNGDDANPGAQARPVRTIAHAIEIALDRMSAPDWKSDDEIVLQAGTYRLAAPIVIHAGPKNHTLIIRSNAAIISGAARVTGWHADASHPGLWVADAPDALKNTRQLYVDGIRAVRARGNLPTPLKQTENGYEAASSEMADWKNPGDIEFVYTGGNSVWGARSAGLGPWTEPRIPVASISGNIIAMAQPAWDNSTKRVMLPPGKFKRAANLVGPTTVGKEPVYVENALELLNQPGEWYFDRTAHLIYYMPRPGED